MHQVAERSMHLPSVQPRLSNVFNLPRFTGFYFLAGVNTKFNKHGKPYWQIHLQDAFGTVCIYCDYLDKVTEQLKPYSPIKIECVQRRYQMQFILVADSVNPVTNIPVRFRHAGLIPFTAAVDIKNLLELVELISDINEPHLQQFVHEVLLQPEVMIAYLRNPASLKYHHNAVGGLLVHSLEVARLLEQQFPLPSIERDIAICSGLLHDIGKTATLSETCVRTSVGSIVDHDDLTLEICALPLSRLSKKVPDIANQLRHAWTCGSPNSRYGFKPQTNIARQLQAADRLSATLSN